MNLLCALAGAVIDLVEAELAAFRRGLYKLAAALLALAIGMLVFFAGILCAIYGIYLLFERVVESMGAAFLTAIIAVLIALLFAFLSSRLAR